MNIVSAGGGDDSVERPQPSGPTHGWSPPAPDIADWIDGGAGNDVIRAGNGDDQLRGGMGRDHLEGGTGADVYVVDAMDDGWDVIDERAIERLEVRIHAGWFLNPNVPAEFARPGALWPIEAGLEAELDALAALSLVLPDDLDWELPWRLGGQLVVTLPVTAHALNTLMRLEQRLPWPQDVSGTPIASPGYYASPIQSRELDQLFARWTGKPRVSDPLLDPAAPGSRPPITFDDQTLTALTADTLRFGPGVDPDAVQAQWSNVDTADGSERALSLSWGGPGGVHVLMPENPAPGVGIERIEFADGTAWSMDAFIAHQTDLLIHAMARVPPSSAAAFTPSFGATSSDPFMPVIAVSAM